MTLSNRRIVSYYLIHPLKDASIEDMLRQLRGYFKVDHFPEIKTLKQEMAFVNKHEIVKVIASHDLSPQDLDYLQNESKINQVILLGKNQQHSALSKVVRAVEPDQLLAALNELEEKDSLTIPPSNLLLVDEDTRLLNKYRLNYQCNTHYMSRNQAKQDFLALAHHLFPQEAQQIDQFAKDYKLELEGEEKDGLVLEWAFKSGFYWQLASEITRNTTDPKRLAYIRLALKDLFESIKAEFARKKHYEDIHIVIDVTEEEKAKLETAKGHFILFTSFMKGYTNEKEANAQLKQRPSAFKFTVIPNRRELDPALDFGYVVGKGEQPNVIYNIYNVFRVEDINIKTRRGEILYGALPENHLRRQSENRLKMSKMELDLMRNYDYLEDMLVKVDSQATLLQLSGYYKESLEVYSRKVDAIRKTSESEENMDRCNIRKADALRISGDFEASEKEYQVCCKSEKMKLVSLIHLAELYMQRGEEEKFDRVIDQIAPKLESLKESEREEYFKARNFVAIRTIKKGSYKKAEQMLNQLQSEVSLSFPFSLEGKPLVHDIYRSRATCQSKLGRHVEALDLLKNTLSWQLVCEGKTANVALTETLIQSVSRSSGNTSEL
jgi:hypothetical protein